MDSGAWLTQNQSATNGFQTLNPTSFSDVSQGNHTLWIKRREGGSQLDNVTLRVSSGVINGSSSSSSSSSSGSSLPTGVIPQDIGSVGTTGNACYDSTNEEITVVASGSTIGESEDSFHFVYANLSGDGQVTFNLNSITSSNPLSQAGVMIRDSLSNNSSNVSLLLTAKKRSSIYAPK